MNLDQDEDVMVADLGAASEVTMGIYDPVMKEALVMPWARDF